MDTLRDPARIAPWLFGIARNVALEARKARRRIGRLVLPDLEADESDDRGGVEAHTPEAELLGREAAGVVDRALDRLSTDRRAVLMLRLDHGLSYDDIAGLMGWTLSKVKVEIHRAREVLREEPRLRRRLFMSGCDFDALESLAAGELTPELASKARSHAAACPACAEELALLRAERAAFADRARGSAPLPGFAAVLARSRWSGPPAAPAPKAPPPAARPSFPWAVSAFGVAAAAAFAGLFLVPPGRRPGSSRPPT